MRSGNIPVLVAIVVVAVAGIGALVGIEYLNTPIDRGFAGQITILVGGVLAFLYAEYRREQTKRAVDECNEKAAEAAVRADDAAATVAAARQDIAANTAITVEVGRKVGLQPTIVVGGDSTSVGVNAAGLPLRNMPDGETP